MRVRVVAGASATRLAGLDGGLLRVRVAAPPVQGQANRALVSFLAAKLGLRPRAVRVVAGARGRDKLVLVEGLSPEAVGHALLPP